MENTYFDVQKFQQSLKKLGSTGALELIHAKINHYIRNDTERVVDYEFSITSIDCPINGPQLIAILIKRLKKEVPASSGYDAAT